MLPLAYAWAEGNTGTKLGGGPDGWFCPPKGGPNGGLNPPPDCGGNPPGGKGPPGGNDPPGN
ncbi:hypothetical protein [Lysinibacillus odysseyi]|uniref:Uncharacterized protein n=2 Tax=Lysinibacillus odysseyi TaxID=202611 RepID=A0A0A3J4B3_9BACI|nr:hypothetical protein [Lysinibacillus odysseyi]KGR81887.1 hypothetical protein CD32_21485 [Lysinibacillus odysseyi 34hs-1 = NBRC 100172]